MIYAERIADYLRGNLPQASAVMAENVLGIHGDTSREISSFHARWQDSISILEQSAAGLHAPTGLTGSADTARRS